MKRDATASLSCSTSRYLDLLDLHSGLACLARPGRALPYLALPYLNSGVGVVRAIVAGDGRLM